MNNTTEIFKMKLFDQLYQGGFFIFRVPGGCLFKESGNGIPAVFVPYSKESCLGDEGTGDE